MTEPNPIPTAGAPVGCYKLIRQVAQGPFGPLYELRSEAETSGLGGLGRLVAVPAELEPETVRTITEAAWDSMEIRHEFALCVADLVFGAGWVTLIHDYSEGSVLRPLQRRCQEKQSAFPLGVALRVVLDMLDGLDANQSVCESSVIAWAPGGASATSLYLCGNGRTRSLDGQLMTTLLRTGPVREQSSAVGFPAPELLSLEQEPDERTDVFCAGTVLWELLTGRELSVGGAILRGQRPRPSVAKLDISVPKGTPPLPSGVMQAVHAAVEIDPANRMATRSAFRSAISANVEVATYAQVIDFTDALLHRESTLFRLDLDPGPKLSDEKRGERPKTPHLEWVIELAKQAQAKSAQKSRIASRAPKKPQSPQSIPSAFPTKPFNPKQAPTQRAARSSGDKPLAKRTLLGLSPQSPVSPAQTSSGFDVTKGPVALPATTQHLATGHAAASKVENSFGKRTLIGLKPAETPPPLTRPDNAATEVGPAEVPSSAAPLTVNGVISIRQPEAPEPSSTTSNAFSLLQGELIEVPRAATEPSPINSDAAVLPPGGARLLESASPSAVTSSDAPQAITSTGKRQVFQLSLTTIILGLCGATGVAVLATILIFTSSSKTSTSDTPAVTALNPASVSAPAAQPPASISGAPARTTEPSAAPSASAAPAPTTEPASEPSLSAAPAPPTPAPSAAPPDAPQSKPETLAGPQLQPSAPTGKATVNPSPSTPKRGGRAQPRPYVPSGL